MKRTLTVVAMGVALVLSAGAEPPSGWTVAVSSDSAVRLTRGGKELGAMRPGLFDTQWRMASMGGTYGVPADDGVHRGRIRNPSGGDVDAELRATSENECVTLSYRLVPRNAMSLNSLNVTLTLPVPAWAGGGCVADGKEVALPKRFGDTQLWSAGTKSLRLMAPGGGGLQLDFADAMHVLVQDDRLWGATFSVRIELPNAPSAWSAGQALAMTVAMRSSEGLVLEEDRPVTVTAGGEWIPLDAAREIAPGSALDFSTVVPRHAPAGQLGRVVVNVEGHFAYARRAEAPVRFYGVNLCFSAQYLAHDVADRLADRLARSGYNAVRFHHYERDLVERTNDGTVRLKPDRLDELDYLFAALKRQGIYSTTDLFVSRPIPANAIYDGESGEFGMDEFKMAVHVNERAYANYTAFARALLDHVNPYTKVRYADDPALAWLSLVNECCPGNFIGRLKGKLRDDWQRAWNRWLAARYTDRAALARALGELPPEQDPAKDNVPFQNVYGSSPAVTVFNVFLADVERDFFARTRAFLRDELGCKALLTDCNAWHNPVQLQAVRADFDYVDDHFYVDHPHFLDRPWSLPSRCPNTSPVAGGATGGRGCAFTRLYGKPFTITEFNYSAPGRFRGVGGILTGALGAVQDWDGLWRFAYSHNRESVAQSAPLNYFDIAGDPLNQAAERACVCLFLRGDIQPAKHAVTLAATPDELLKNATTSCDKTPAWQRLAWCTRVGWSIGDDRLPSSSTLRLPFDGGKAMQGGESDRILDAFRRNGWLAADVAAGYGKGRLACENGEVTIDAPADVLRLDTPLTAGGFAPAGRAITTRAADFAVLDTDATVWVSSLDGKPIVSSKRLLITHLTDLQNSDSRYGDRARQVLLAWGRLPHLVRAGRAVVTLRRDDAAPARVYALGTSGVREGEIEVRVSKGGALEIPLSVDANGKARMLYEVTVGE